MPDKFPVPSRQSLREQRARTKHRHAASRARHTVVSAGAVAAVFALLAGFALAPPPLRADARTAGGGSGDTQTLTVAGEAGGAEVHRDGASVTPGAQTLAAGGTNADWATLVLMYGGWPQTEENVTVMLRWMRQENGTASWWNRNNPLNNGYGSGGGSGLGSYPDLATAAQKAAENLQRMDVYSSIVASLAASGTADDTARAIWASPWASSHYANGAHWSSTPVPVVEAPDSAW